MNNRNETSERKSTQLAVIGAGPGGYAAAFLAADLGLTVTLIDTEPDPGGVCLFRGCIPSKALLHVARLLAEARAAAEWGIRFGEPDIDLAALRKWKEGVVGQLTGGLGQLARQRKVDFIRGRAHFRNARQLRISPVEGGAFDLSCEHVIVATGSRPSRIPGIETDSRRILDSSRALELEKIPDTLLVVGGGYIGLEMGTVYAALGSRVTVVEMMDGLLPGVDRDLVKPVQKSLAERFDRILLRARVENMAEKRDGIEVTMRPEGDDAVTERFDAVLVAIGRRPNSADLGLENTGVKTDERGFIQVNPQRRTHDPAIYAIGDVAGEPMLAHKATHEGRVAAEAIAGHKTAFEPRAIPAVVFTDPELAWCGLTENEAREQDRPVEIVRFPWAASGRALTMGRPDGLTKLIIDSDTERILGMGVVGAGAGELIAEGVLAVEMAALATDLKLSIHPHPTLSETVMEAAEMLFGQSTHVYRPQRRR